MATGIYKTHYAEKAVLNALLRATNLTAPTNIYVALQLADTLQAAASIGQPTISMNISPPVGSTIVIDSANGGIAETRTVSSVSGSGPYTVTLSSVLVFAHSSGVPITINPFEVSGSDVLSGLNEVANANGYARQAVTFAAPVRQSTTGANCASNADVTFPASSGAWGWVTHFLIYDSSTYGAGNLLYYVPVTTVKYVNAGDQYIIPSGQLNILED